MADVWNWLVWQSLTGCWSRNAAPYRSRRADTLGTRDTKGGDLVAAGTGQLKASPCESRSV